MRFVQGSAVSRWQKPDCLHQKNARDILVQSDLTGEFQKTELQRKSI